MGRYSTKQIADKFGVHPNTVRLYEKYGYLSIALRMPNGYRVYTEQHLEQMTIARIAFPGPYPVDSRPLFKMIQAFKCKLYSVALMYAGSYREAVLLEQKKSKAALKLLDQWHNQKYGSDKIVANTRKEFATLSQLSVETIRTWERNGIYQPQVNSSRYKNYSQFDYEKVQIIRLLRKRGFSIASLAKVFGDSYSEVIPSVYLERIYKNSETGYEADEWLKHIESHIERSDKLIEIISKKL